MMLFDSFTMFLPVYNEGERIERVISYYKNIAPLIVIDNYSTDDTLEKLKKYEIEYLQKKNPGTTQTPEFLKFLIDISKTDYFVTLSASEFISLPLFEIFNRIAIEKKYDIVSCVVDSYTCGELIPLWGGRIKGIDRRIERFFNKNELDYQSVFIHSKLKVKDKQKILFLPRKPEYVIKHLRDSDTLSLMKKHIDYARVEAKMMYSNDLKNNIIRLFLKLLKELLRIFLVPLKKLNGITFREIWARIVMHTMTYWFGWELRKNKGIEYSKIKSQELWFNLLKENI